jgi:Leucine-rich repeat (LRR) protein
MNVLIQARGVLSGTTVGNLTAVVLLVVLLTGCDKAKEALEKTKEKASELAKNAKEQIDKANIKPLERTPGDGMTKTDSGEEEVPTAPIDPAVVAAALINDFGNATVQQSKNDEKFRKLAALDAPFLAQVVKLELQGTSISNEALKEIAKFPNLKSLNVSQCRQMSGPGFATIGQCAALETLIAEASGFDDAALEALKPLTNIKNLNVSQTNVTDTGMTVVLGFTALETLALEGCKGVTGKSFAKGPCPPGLVEFLANESNFGVHGAPGLKGANLQVVRLRSSGLDDKQAPKLYTIASLRELWINVNNLSDKGIKGVTALKGLEILYINGTQIQGKQMTFLKQMKSLKELHVESLSISPNEREELSKALPDTKISY